ncbi:MAG: hypothetical protein K2X87_24515 [Gemmataceae bacterium]|nr:hypothetical protein [Gemmataceae bacterium]
MSTSPVPEFKSNQYEFTDEQNRTISQLVDGMRTVATLIQLLGLAFVVFLGLAVYQGMQQGGSHYYGTAAGLGAGALLCLSIGFWTGGSATSFRRIVETKNEDVWHLMNALESLRNMYGLLRAIILVSLVLIVVGLALAGYAAATRGG